MRIWPSFYEDEGGKLPGRKIEYAKSLKKRAGPSDGWRCGRSENWGQRCQRRLGRWVTEDTVHHSFFSDFIRGSLRGHMKDLKLGCDVIGTSQEF